MSQTSVTSAPKIGIPGSAADLQTALNGTVDTAQSEEASAEITFGVMVKAGTGDRGALKCTATTNVLRGISFRAHSYADSQVGDTGVKPGTFFGVGQKGRFFVLIEENVTPTSDVRVRMVATGNEIAGAFRATADSTDCIELTPLARWVRTALAADGVAELEIDLTNAALATADA